MASEHTEQHPSRWLLTALGVHPSPTTYQLDGETATAEHAPLALLQLLAPAQRPQQVLTLLTPEAREKAWPGFEQACAQLNIPGHALDIASGESTGDMVKTLQAVAETVPEGCELILDITHGYRYLPFLLYPLALYLTAFRGVRISSAWYGKLEGNQRDAPKPLIRLDALLDLPEWFYAVRVFVETGATEPLAKRFHDLEHMLPEGPERGPPRQAAKALHAFSTAYELGLPLEAGSATGKLAHTLETNPLGKMTALDLPLADALSNTLLQAIQSLRFATTTGLAKGQSKGQWKKSISLDQTELQRQARLIDLYLQRNQAGQALALMREWVVSLGVLHRNQPEHWLERGRRLKVERELGAMIELGKQTGTLSEDQRGWATFWDRLGQQRNALAHAGMRYGDAAVAETKLTPIVEHWNAIKRATNAWEPFGGGGGRLLITPLGKSPGVLYSAITHTHPVAIMVVCSIETKPDVAHAVEAAKMAIQPKILCLQDPMCGYGEIAKLVSTAQTRLLAADEVVVNLTGGTTMMGIAAQRLSEKARSLQRDCRRFILIDRRSVDEQKQSPWIKGEAHWLDSSPEETAND